RDIGGVRCVDVAPDQHCIRRAPGQQGFGPGFPRADVRASLAGSVPGNLSARTARGLVPARGSTSWIIWDDADMPSLIDLMLEGRKIPQPGPWPRGVVDASVWKFAASELEHGRWILLGLWAEPSTVHMAIMNEHTAEATIVSLDCPDRH